METRSIDWVPLDERHGTLGSQFRFWFIGNFLVLTAVIGFIGPGLGLSFGWAALSSVGSLLGAAFMALHASQGPTLGLPQMVQTRAQLGYRGVIVALAATLFCFLSLNTLDTILLGNGLNSIFGWNSIAVGVVVGVAAALLAIVGHDWLHKLFTAVFCVSLPMFVILFLGILSGHAGPHPTAVGSFSLLAFVAQFVGGASYNIAFAPYVSDFSRYLPPTTSRRTIVATVFIGAGGSGVVMIIFGSWLATALGATDIFVGILQAGDNLLRGFGTVLVVVSVIALVATMGMTAYSAQMTTITALHCFRDLRLTRNLRIIVIAALAVVWTAVGLLLLDSASAVSDVLVIMLYLLIPWSALNLMDYFVIRKAHYSITDMFNPDGLYGRWSRSGLLAYALGILSMIPFATTSFFHGPLVETLGGVDYAWLVGLLVSGAAYFILARGRDLGTEEAAIARSDAELRRINVRDGEDEMVRSTTHMNDGGSNWPPIRNPGDHRAHEIS